VFDHVARVRVGLGAYDLIGVDDKAPFLALADVGAEETGDTPHRRLPCLDGLGPQAPIFSK
jgi:hypothetical protein